MAKTQIEQNEKKQIVEPNEKTNTEHNETEIDAEIAEAFLDETLEADQYCIGTDIDAGLMRLQLHSAEEGVGLLGSLTVDSAGAYELAHRILRGYDKLEGL